MDTAPRVLIGNETISVSKSHILAPALLEGVLTRTRRSGPTLDHVRALPVPAPILERTSRTSEATTSYRPNDGMK